MPEERKHRFVIGCPGCQRTLMTVNRIGKAEVEGLEAHLRACAASQPLGRAPVLGDIMRRLRVEVVNRA